MSSRSCEGCGYKIKRPDGYLTEYQGKTWHVSCLEQHIVSRKKTEELLADCPKLKAIMLG